MEKNQKVIKANSYRDAKKIYQVLDNKVRLKMIQLIASKGQISVSDLSAELDMVYAIASMHLRLLRQYNIVISEIGEDTRQRIYSINWDVIVKYNNISKDLIEVSKELE